MGKFVRGQVVVVNFPFADAKEYKKRPAVVLAGIEQADYILCMITKVCPATGRFVELTDGSFEKGGLKVSPSYVRPGKIFTANKTIIKNEPCGLLHVHTVDQIINEIQSILTE